MVILTSFQTSVENRRVITQILTDLHFFPHFYDQNNIRKRIGESTDESESMTYLNPRTANTLNPDPK